MEDSCRCTSVSKKPGLRLGAGIAKAALVFHFNCAAFSETFRYGSVWRSVRRSAGLDASQLRCNEFMQRLPPSPLRTVRNRTCSKVSADNQVAQAPYIMKMAISGDGWPETGLPPGGAPGED